MFKPPALISQNFWITKSVLYSETCQKEQAEDAHPLMVPPSFLSLNTPPILHPILQVVHLCLIPWFLVCSWADSIQFSLPRGHDSLPQVFLHIPTWHLQFHRFPKSLIPCKKCFLQDISILMTHSSLIKNISQNQIYVFCSQAPPHPTFPVDLMEQRWFTLLRWETSRFSVSPCFFPLGQQILLTFW